MLNDEANLNALGEILVPVLASVESCHAYEFWRKTYGQTDGSDALYVYGEYETINDATILFSLISLRKIDDFLSDTKKMKPKDIRYSDFGICRETVLLERESIISQDVRNKINKCIAHLTDLGDPSVDDWEGLEQALEMAKPTLNRLKEVIRRLLKLSDEQVSSANLSHTPRHAPKR